MSDYLTPKAREHFERASAKGCVCGLCELIAALPETIREVKAQALEEAADAWQHGEWTNKAFPAKSSGTQLILGMAQHANDFLRARAQQLKEEAWPSQTKTH